MSGVPIIGILLAAGRSSRMGVNKQLLPWPPGSSRGTTVGAASFDLLARVVDGMVLVEGFAPEPLRAALHPRRFVPVAGAPDGEMIESLQRGLEVAESLRGEQLDSRPVQAPSGCAPQPGWFVIHLADHPAVRGSTVDLLLARAGADPSRVIIPEHAGRGGHPAIVPASWCSRILEWRGSGGLAGMWRGRAGEVTRVPVEDPGVRVDLDTPMEYETHR